MHDFRHFAGRIDAAGHAPGLDTLIRPPPGRDGGGERSRRTAPGERGASVGAIATFDETGVPRDFVTAGFTDEDEEILVLFASPAAPAIANARTYRAALEALLETLGKPDMVSKINRTPPPGGREAPRTCAAAGWCGCVCSRG